MRILSFGGGVDSSAILLKHLTGDVDLNIDQVVFSDTGAEKSKTYANITKFQQLCEAQNIPFDIVRNQKESLTEFLTRLGTVPLMPGCSHICSLKFKGEVIQKFLKEKYGDRQLTILIGIEADELYRKQRFTKPKNDTNEYEYPLIDMDMTRADCEAYLQSHGFDVVKSSCVYCPFMSEEEIKEIRQDKEAWQTIKLVESRFAEESNRKHQAWLDAGKPLNKGGNCFAGHWKKDPWANGKRLFVKRINGKQLSVAEWEAA